MAIIGGLFIFFLVGLVITFLCVRNRKKKQRRRLLEEAHRRRVESNLYVIPTNLEEVNQYGTNNSHFYGQENLSESPPPKYEDLPIVKTNYLKRNDTESSHF